MTRALHDFRVCIDSRMLGEGGTGVSTYTRALRDALPLVTEDRTLLQSSGPAPLGRLGKWLAALPRGPREARPIDHRGGLGETLLAARDLFRVAQVHFDVHGRLMPVAAPGPPGIMHWTYPVPLRLENWINVYTVHDAIPLLAPELTTIAPRRHRRLLGAIAETADAIVTVSDAARADIAAALGDDAPPIVNCGIGVEAGNTASALLPAGLQPGRYLLVCGSIEPRKNIARLLAAYSESGIKLPLVLAGPDGMDAAALNARIAATPGALRLPYVTDDVLQSLLAGARALLMPSLAEGFGLPIIEAMVSGTPVLTSNRGAPAETAGGAALLVEPFDVQAIAAGIAALAGDDAFCRRLAEAGRANAERFTRARFAERLGAFYRDLMPAAPRSPRREAALG